MAFEPQDNPLRKVRVEIPKESVLRNFVEELMKGIDYKMPAEKNFLAAERRNPSRTKKHYYES